MKNKTKGLLAAYGMVLPAFLVVMLTVAYPIVSAVIQSFQDEDTGAFTTANYTYFFTETAQRNNLLYTLFVVIVTVVITIIRDSGLINRIGLLFGLDIKLGLMYHASGIIVMNMWFNIPFATMMIAAGLGAIPDSIIEASRDSGAGRWKTFTSMILPLSMKDVVVASTFVFMSNVGSFTTPYLMGGNSPKMLGIALYDQFNKYLSYNRSAALSVIMFLICSVSAAVYIYTNLKEKDWEK